MYPKNEKNDAILKNLAKIPSKKGDLKKRGFGPGVRLGQSMLGNISFNRKIEKNTNHSQNLEKKGDSKNENLVQGLGQVSLCQVISLSKEKLGKILNYFFKKGKKITKKQKFCPGVRLGQSMLDNRFLKSLQKTTKNHTEKQKFSHFITKMYPQF